MTARTRRRRSTSRQVGRDTTAYTSIATARPRPAVLDLIPWPVRRSRRTTWSSKVSIPPIDLSLFEDNRQWSPDTYSRTTRRLGGVPARLSVSNAVSTSGRPGKHRSYFFPSPTVTFQRPGSVVLCIRRHVRRQVLHAFSIAGKKGLNPPRRTAASNISCRG